MLLETRQIPKIVKYLLLINVTVYIFSAITGLHNWSIQCFGLIPQTVIHGFQIWRLFTYLFIHAGPLHLILNMLALWIFGPEIERRMGRSQFLFYYFLTGAGGGLLPLMLGHISIGASPSIFGLLVAFAVMFPDTIISLIFPPVSMKAKNFVIIFGACQFIMFLGKGSGIAWEAHLGGMFFGYMYFRFGVIKKYGTSLKNRYKKLKNGMEKIKIYEKKRYIEEEIDPILDKISKTGIKGLTRKERQILKKAKYKIQK